MVKNKLIEPDKRKRTKELLDEILNAEWLVGIDVDDIENLLKGGGEIHAIDVKVNATREDRINCLMEQIRNSAKSFEPYNYVFVYFLFPKNNSLTMGELEHFNEWIETVPGELKIKCGMAIQTTQKLRAIVLLQRSNITI